MSAEGYAAFEELNLPPDVVAERRKAEAVAKAGGGGTANNLHRHPTDRS